MLTTGRARYELGSHGHMVTHTARDGEAGAQSNATVAGRLKVKQHHTDAGSDGTDEGLSRNPFLQ